MLQVCLISFDTLQGKLDYDLSDFVGLCKVYLCAHHTEKVGMRNDVKKKKKKVFVGTYWCLSYHDYVDLVAVSLEKDL